MSWALSYWKLVRKPWHLKNTLARYKIIFCVLLLVLLFCKDSSQAHAAPKKNGHLYSSHWKHRVDGQSRRFPFCKELYLTAPCSFSMSWHNGGLAIEPYSKILYDWRLLINYKDRVLKEASRGLLDMEQGDQVLAPWWQVISVFPCFFYSHIMGNLLSVLQTFQSMTVLGLSGLAEHPHTPASFLSRFHESHPLLSSCQGLTTCRRHSPGTCELLLLRDWSPRLRFLASLQLLWFSELTSRASDVASKVPWARLRPGIGFWTLVKK